VKAVDGNFEIVGEGKVVQCYMVEGKEKKITYTRALHTPTLNANLISISAFDKAGLTNIACMTDTKASHHIPRSYRHAILSDPERWMVPM
jgi:hypothetical protein